MLQFRAASGQRPPFGAAFVLLDQLFEVLQRVLDRPVIHPEVLQERDVVDAGANRAIHLFLAILDRPKDAPGVEVAGVGIVDDLLPFRCETTLFTGRRVVGKPAVKLQGAGC